MALDAATREQLLETVPRFVREKCVPMEAMVAEDDCIPDGMLAEMRALGLFGLSIPLEYDWLRLTMEEEALVVTELCHTSPAFRSAIGTKRFITNADRAGMLTLLARTDPRKKGASGISAFIVPADIKGISIGKPEKKMGQQGAHICDVIFENARVLAHLRLGEEGEGFKLAMQVLDRGRLHISSVCVGVAERLIGEAVAYAQEREQFGRKIAEFQLIQAMLADSKTEAYAARAMLIDAARKYDSGQSVTMAAACAKYFASEMVGRVADRTVQIFGGAGYVADYGIERFYRDVRIFRIYEGTSQVQQLVIAKNLLKGGA